ncbi:MAG: hypothetical protein ACRD7E_18310 [Bryobacteraceae bacterium]
MKYWGILAAKILVAVVLLYYVWFGLHTWYELPEHVKRFGHDPFLHDLPWTTIMLVYSLLCTGIGALIVVDQRYRCRACGRRLRMPVTTGRYAQMLLFGPPRTEYICVYGHGTLKVPDLQLSGMEMPDWEEHEDIWTELQSMDETRK